MVFLLLFISIVPVVILGFFIYKKDTVKEPISLLISLFCSGLIASFIVMIVNILMLHFIPELYITDNYLLFGYVKLFVLTFLEVALVEEFSKWIMIRFIGYPHKDFDQLYDIIVYSVFVGLGFAAIENVFYVLEGGFSLGIYRAIFSVPGHVAFGVFMGYFLGLAKIWEKKDKRKFILYMFLSVLVPTVLHTIYNYFLMFDALWFLLIFIGFIIILYVTALREVDKVSQDKDSLI